MTEKTLKKYNGRLIEKSLVSQNPCLVVTGASLLRLAPTPMSQSFFPEDGVPGGVGEGRKFDGFERVFCRKVR